MQIEQALQTADHQIEALRARVTRKNAQLSDAKLQLEHIREDMHDIAVSQRHAPPSLPDTESSEQTGDALPCLDDLSGHLSHQPCFVCRWLTLDLHVLRIVWFLKEALGVTCSSLTAFEFLTANCSHNIMCFSRGLHACAQKCL